MITNAIEVLLICIFAFVPLLLGEIARNKSNLTINDFFLQNRNLSIVPLFGTIFATWMSVFAFLGSVGYFYNRGPIYMTSVGWDALFAVLFILIGRRIWFYGKRRGYFTPVDFFDDIYGSKVLNILVIVITVVCTMIYLQVQIVGGLMVMSIATDGEISVHMGTFIFFFTLVIYLWAGGLRAVAYTDLFYMILTVTAVLGIGFYIINLAGGTETVFNHLISRNVDFVTLTGKDGINRTLTWLCLFIVVPVGAFMGPQMWIRNYASSKESNFNILPLLICLSSVLCLGTLLSGSGCASLVKHTDNAEGLLVKIVMENASPYFYVFALTGIYATIFSTANSQIHALSAVYTIDIHRRYVNNNEPERNLVSIAKLSVLVVSAVSYFLVILIPHSVYDLAVISLGGTLQLIVPVIGGLFWRRSTHIGAIMGLIVGEAMYILSIYFDSSNTSMYAILALILNILCFISGSLTDSMRIKTYNKIQLYRDEYNSRHD